MKNPFERLWSNKKAEDSSGNQPKVPGLGEFDMGQKPEVPEIGVINGALRKIKQNTNGESEIGDTDGGEVRKIIH